MDDLKKNIFDLIRYLKNGLVKPFRERCAIMSLCPKSGDFTPQPSLIYLLGRSPSSDTLHSLCPSYNLHPSLSALEEQKQAIPIIGISHQVLFNKSSYPKHVSTIIRKSY